jgi:hypothetical protein
MAGKDRTAIVGMRTTGFRGLTRLKIEHLWMGLPVFVLLVKGMTFPLPLYDFWWHLKTGQIIVTTRSIPRTDIFSFTAEGKEFILQNWLAEVIYYLLYMVGGLEFLVTMNALLLAIALVPVYILCFEASGNVRLSSFVTFLAALTFPAFARPQTFSVLLFALFYWVLSGYTNGRRDRLWLLPILIVFWANLHGAFVLGLGLVALYSATALTRKLVVWDGRDFPRADEWRKLGAIFGACVLATLSNPEVFRIYDYVLTVMSDKGSQLFVSEWQPPVITTIEGVVLFYGLFFICLLVLLYSSRQLAVTDVVLFLVFSAFAMSAIRNGIWFSIIAAPILAGHAAAVFDDLATRFEKSAWLEAIKRRITVSTTSPSLYRVNFALVVCAGLFLIGASPWVRPRLNGASLLQEETPVAAADFIQKNDIQGRIFHPHVFGDYLIWRLWPQQKSYFDGRVHLFGEDFVKQYLALFFDNDWERNLKRHDVRFLLLSKDPREAGQARMLGAASKSTRWLLLYEDEAAAFFGLNEAAPPGACGENALESDPNLF